MLPILSNVPIPATTGCTTCTLHMDIPGTSAAPEAAHRINNCIPKMPSPKISWDLMIIARAEYTYILEQQARQLSK